MAKIYYRRIKAGQMTLDQVPEKWREEVRKMLLEDLGFVNHGNGLVSPESELGQAILQAINNEE